MVVNGKKSTKLYLYFKLYNWTSFKWIEHLNVSKKQENHQSMSINMVNRQRMDIVNTYQKKKNQYKWPLEHVKICWTSVIILEMQVKITLSYYFSPVRWTKLYTHLTTHSTGKVVGQQIRPHSTCRNINTVTWIEGRLTISQVPTCLPFAPITQMQLPM